MMRENKFKEPLIKSAAIIAIAIIFLCFVANSTNQSLGGCLWAIVSGIVYSVLYIVGLSVGILFCIAFLITIFLIAVGCVSPRLSANMYKSIKDSIQAIPTEEYIKSCVSKTKAPYKSLKSKKGCNSGSYQPDVHGRSQQTEMQEKIEELERELTLLKEKESENSSKIEQLLQQQNK